MGRFNKKNKYIIFGTGSQAKQINDNLLKENIQPEFFIDSMLTKNEFCNKKVFNLDYLSQIPANNYKYLLGSIGNAASMRFELISLGIKECNIETFMDYSEAGLENRVKNINKILIYPECNKSEQANLELILDKYLCYREYISVELNHNNCDWSKINIAEYDVVLVWDKSRLNDTYLYSSNVVFCIDNSFYPAIMERILLRLAYKINKKYNIYDFEKISQNNFSKLLSQNYSESYVFGNGPSLEDGLKLYKKSPKNTSCSIVCNAYIHIKSDYAIIPNIYCFEDIVFLTPPHFNTVLSAMECVCNNNSFLIVPEFWIPFLYKFNPNILKCIIGYKLDSASINIPDINNLNICCKGGNVITATCIPFASSITNCIYISGCDGIKNKTTNKMWEYSDKLTQIKNTDLSNIDWGDYNEKHNNYFNELLLYGEKAGNKYICITNSYIQCLNIRKGSIL